MSGHLLIRAVEKIISQRHAGKRDDQRHLFRVAKVRVASYERKSHLWVSEEGRKFGYGTSQQEA